MNVDVFEAAQLGRTAGVSGLFITYQALLVTSGLAHELTVAAMYWRYNIGAAMHLPRRLCSLNHALGDNVAEIREMLEAGRQVRYRQGHREAKAPIMATVFTFWAQTDYITY